MTWAKAARSSRVGTALGTLATFVFLCVPLLSSQEPTPQTGTTTSPAQTGTSAPSVQMVRPGEPGGTAAPATITLADILRAVDGPLAAVRGERPESIRYEGSARALADVWFAVRTSMRSVIEHVTLEDLVNGPLPRQVTDLSANPDAWVSG